MPWSSNGTFLAEVELDGVSLPAVYKPHRGERPLWDFPDGLYQREVAAYELSEALGWQLVPETVLREEAPLGAGSLQRFVEADFEQHYFTLLEEPRYHPALQAMAVFDLVANNADRKGGHCLLDGDHHIWGIDHGLCFHVEPKLRTVIWDFGGEPIGGSLLEDLERLAGCVPPALASLLDPTEVAALIRRASRLVRLGVFPAPGEGRPYPWPLV
jgi:uncharacterized repeat protein (TIGR03843 family)